MKNDQLTFINKEEIDYSNIPLSVIGENVLEVGVSTRIVNSHLWSKIKQGRYTGIDVVNRVKDTDLNIIVHDVCTYDFKDEKFDTIISVQTFEHINLWDWPEVFRKLKSILLPGGKLIIVLPHNEKSNKRRDGAQQFPQCLTLHDRFQQHLVFGINRKMLEHFLPGAHIYRKTRFIFRQDGCSLVWGVLRFIKRLAFGGFYPIRRNIYAIWSKN